MSYQDSKRDLYTVFIISLITILVMRICLSNYLTLYGDLNVFVGWGAKISKVGFTDFYSTYWCDYMPGYLYILWILDGVHSIFPGIPKEILYKLPANISDLIISILIFASLRNYFTFSKSAVASLIYFINPAVISNSTLWGQIDTLHALPIVISCLFALRQRVILSSIFITLGFLIKPQTIIISPIVVALIFIPLIREHYGFKQIFRYALLFTISIFITTFVVVLPFIINEIAHFADILIRPLEFTIQRFIGSYEQYQKASLNAFNFWGTLAMWKSDQARFIGITYQNIGTLVFLSTYVIVFFSFIDILKKLVSKDNFKKYIFSFQVIAIISLTAFLFLTRVHERHLLTTIVFLAFVAITSRLLIYIYLSISSIYVLNIIYAYGKLTDYKAEFSHGLFKPIIYLASSVLILLLIFLLSDFLKTSSFLERLRFYFVKIKTSFISPHKRRNLVYIALLILFILSFSLKVIGLGHPERYYFDENFFAFTSQEMAKGNPLGWQMGERAPGKAEYEWTHPPLGKEISAVGILIFGDSTFSWRIMQALFGALGTIFIYLLAGNLFNSRSAGIIASILYTFESIIFVFSRIALVDIYLFNFLMLASLFFVKYSRDNRSIFLVLTALFTGAAMSVKWSGAFILGLLFSLTIIVAVYKDIYHQSRQPLYIELPKIILIFLFIPIMVYVASYIPYFLNGNSLFDFTNFQETMFNYHVNVSKQNAYRSEWWSWPLLIRPLCLYIEKLGSYREYIYAIGNPVIWWSGVIAMMVSIYYAIRYKYYPLLFVILSFFAYILPWSISPRKITYIYHYMPSLLFVILALTFLLNKLWNSSYKARIFVTYFLISVIASFLFFYPILSGAKVPKSQMKDYRWMKTWR